MMIPNTASRVFYPGEMAALGEAFHRSCEYMRAAGDVRFSGRQEHYAKETIARLIIGYASAGERDPNILSRETLRTMNSL
jgi:hypothetical protein